MTLRRRPPAVPANPFLLWGTLGLKTMQMSAAAAQVIALRTTRMALHGPNPSAADRREMVRMGAEKVDAFTRAGQAVALGALPLMMGMAMLPWRAGADPVSATARLAHKALAPVHRKATANAKRLSSRKAR